MSFYLLGIKTTVSFPACAVFTLILIFSGGDQVFWGVLAALCHEMGHLFILLKNGTKPLQISINLFDIKIAGRCLNNYCKSNIQTLLFGPLFNFIIFIAIYTIRNICEIDILYCFMMENLVLCAFNLLPVYLLDGGQILQILICKKTTPNTAEKILYITSFFVLFVIATFGFILMLKSKYNFSLLFVSAYLLVCLVVKVYG